MLPKPSQWLPGWQPCIQAGGDVALPLRMPFWRGWAGGQGLLPCFGPVASATGRFFTLHTKTLMAMLHFSRIELRKAFYKFSRISRSTSGSTQIGRDFLLYAIYAAECGLKYLLMGKRIGRERINTTRQLEDKYLNHNLTILSEEAPGIKSSKSKFQGMIRKGNKKHKDHVSTERLHELYRYGGQLDKDSESNLIKDLSDLLTQIENQLD